MFEYLPSTTLNLDDLLTQLVERAREIIPFDGGGIAVYDPETRLLTPHTYHGAQAAPALSEGVSSQVAASMQPVLINDLPPNPYGMRSEIATPLALEGRLLGVFIAQSSQPDAYQPTHLKILQTLADQAALVLNTARLYRMLSQRYERLSDYSDELYLRNEVSRLAASDAPIETLLPKMLGHLTALVRADACALTLWDHAERRPHRLSAYGLDLGEYLSARRRPRGIKSLTEQIVNTGKTVIVNQAQLLAEPPSPLIQEYEVRALIAMPLVARGRPIGAAFLLNLTSDAPFAQSHADRAHSLLDQIALAIDNRMLLQDMQERLSETAALLEIAALAAISLPIDEMLNSVLKLSRQMFGITAAAFLLYDRVTNTLELHPSASFGIPPEFNSLRVAVNEPGNHIAIVFTSGSPYYSNDLRSAARDSSDTYTAMLARLGLHNLMLAPLRVQDEPMGVFLIGNKRGDLTRADAQLLMAMGSHVAAALRNSELLADMRERLRETEALQRIAAITSSTLNLDEMLERALREAAELLEAEGALLIMPNPEQNALLPHNRSRYGSGRWANPHPLPLDSSDPAVQVYITGLPYVSNNATEHHRSIIAFPLSTRNRTLGVLTLLNRRSGGFGEGHIELTRAIASQIATSMENAQLFAAERQRADLMALVNHISQELAATLSLSELTRKVVKAVHERLGYETVHVMLLDDGGLNLTVRSSVSSLPGMSLPEDFSIPFVQGIIGRAMRSGETQVVADVSADKDFIQLGALRPTGSLVVVPLRYGTRTLGVIEALVPRLNGFQQIDRTVLETLAAQLSIGIENARLWDQARKRLLEQGIVHQISQDLSAILDYNELVSAIVKHMGRALDTAVCLLAIYDSDTGQATVEAEYTLPELAESVQIPSHLGQPLGEAERAAIDRAIRTRRQVIVAREAESGGAYTELVLPMVSAGDRAIGCVLWIEMRSAREFSGGDVRLAQTLSTQAAIAIENARLFRQAQRQAHEQTLLRRIAVGLSNMPDVKTMLEQFAHEIVQAVPGVDNVAIAMRSSEGRLDVVAHYLTNCELRDMLLSHLTALPDAEALMLAVLEPGAALHINTLSRGEGALAGWLSAYLRRRLCGEVLVPIMRRRREVIGIIEVSTDNAARLFDSHEMQLLEALANQGAIAYDNISYHQREQRRLRQLERLQASSKKIAGQLRTSVLLDTIVREAAEVFEAPAVSLMTPDAEGKYYVIRAAIGLSERYIRERCARVVEYAEVRTFDRSDAQRLTDDSAQQALISDEGLQSVTSVPLIKAGTQLGILNIYGKETPRRFTEEEKELAYLFSGQAAIALENATLFEALEERAVELAQANRLKSEFLARMSHELRTPMNSINGYSEMLLRQIYGPLTDKQSDRIERILRNGRNLLALIDDLLDLSKIDAGKMELTIEPVNLRDELVATIYNLESQAAERGLYLRLEAPDDVPLVSADSMRVRQVITNLLSNAIKFTKQGGVTAQIKVVESEGNREVWTQITDTGVGIRPEDQEIIFDEFRQADGSTTREFGGTGLGLAITRKLLEMMHGRIWVESKSGEGSTFTFALPVKPVA